MAFGISAGPVPAAIAESGSDSEARPLNKPIPIYPTRALQEGLVGACDVMFDITPVGTPENTTAACTHEVFCRASLNAMRKAGFAPRIIDGYAVRRTNVIYPIKFAIPDDKTGKLRRIDPRVPYAPCPPPSTPQ